MNSLTHLLPPALVDALGWTLLHSLWQVTFIAFTVGALMILMRRTKARTRYTIATTGLLTSFVVVVLTFSVLYKPNIQGAVLTAAEQEIVAQKQTQETIAPLPLPNAESAIVHDSSYQPSAASLPSAPAPSVSALSSPSIGARKALETLHFMPLTITPQEGLMQRIQEYMPLIVIGWILGMIGFGLRLIGGVVYAQRMKTYRTFAAAARWQEQVRVFARRLQCSHVPALLESGLANVPMVVGFLKPVILVPVGFLTGLRPEYVEAILAHEIAHIRRKDYILSVLQAAIETLMFYHPAIWWLSSQMREEREHASDDLASSLCGDSRALASALALLEERNFAHTELPFATASVAATDGHLLRRVKRLLGKQPERSFSLEYLAAYLVITCVFALSLTASPGLQPVIKPVLDPVVENARRTASSLAERLLPPTIPPALSSPDNALAPQDSSRSKKKTFSSFWDNDSFGAISAEGFWEAKFKESSLTLVLFKEKWGNHRYNNTMYTGLQYSEVQGLNVEQARSASGDIQFRLPKESGTFIFTGETQSGIARGNYTFQPNQQYQEQLKALGYKDINDRHLITIALTNVKRTVLQELAGLNLDMNDAIEIAILGINADYVREARKNGLSGEEIREYGVLGIKNEYIAAMKKHGYSLEDIKELGVLGIKHDYVNEMKSLGIAVHEIKEYGVLGIKPEKVKAMKEAGVPSDEIKEYGVLGIHPEYVRSMKALGYKVEDIKNIGVLGIKPEMVKEYKEAGVPIGEIKEFGVLGIKTEYIKKMKAFGYSIEETKELGVLGIKPETVKEYKDAGVKHGEIQEFGVLGIKTSYIKEMRALGYKHDDIKELGVLGIKPETVKSYKEAGLNLADIKDFAMLGIQPAFVKQMREKGFSADDIRDLGVRGVKMDVINALRDAGFHREDISNFGMRGIKPEYIKQLKAFGFTNDEIEELGARGIKINIAKEYKALGFDADDIADLAGRGIKPSVAKELKAMGFDADDIADLGVRGIRISTIQKLKADGLSNRRIMEILLDYD